MIHHPSRHKVLRKTEKKYNDPEVTNLRVRHDRTTVVSVVNYWLRLCKMSNTRITHSFLFIQIMLVMVALGTGVLELKNFFKILDARNFVEQTLILVYLSILC